MTDTTPSSRPTITRIGTVAVPVDDQERALGFYVGTLGFETWMDAEFAPGQRWIEVAPTGAPASVALVRSEPENPAGVDTGIRLSTTETLPATMRRSRRRASRSSGADPGARADVRDPGPGRNTADHGRPPPPG